MNKSKKVGEGARKLLLFPRNEESVNSELDILRRELIGFYKMLLINLDQLGNL